MGSQPTFAKLWAGSKVCAGKYWNREEDQEIELAETRRPRACPERGEGG